MRDPGLIWAVNLRGVNLLETDRSMYNVEHFSFQAGA
jgi:hypothetical protein